MDITQVIQSVGNTSAGTSYYAARLAENMSEKGLNFSTMSLGQEPNDWPDIAPLSIKTTGIGRKAGFSFHMMRDIQKLSHTPGILHGHGLWRGSNLFPLLVKKNSPRKVVFSVHGMLTPWSFNNKRLLKLPFWQLLQLPALKKSHLYHVTAASEYEDIRRVGLKNPVAIVPIGIDIPKQNQASLRRKQLVFLSRINPKKGLDILLPAWSTIALEYPEWELLIVGPIDTEYAQQVVSEAKKCNIPRIQFMGEITGDKKTKLLLESSIFVLPSYSENFGIVITEALAHGLPVITTTETPWQELNDKQCGWCIQPNQKQLERSLRHALSTSPAMLQEMGEKGRNWMIKEYSWGQVSDMMLQTYDWLINKGSAPSWVIYD